MCHLVEQEQALLTSRSSTGPIVFRTSLYLHTLFFCIKGYRTFAGGGGGGNNPCCLFTWRAAANVNSQLLEGEVTAWHCACHSSPSVVANQNKYFMLVHI